jgi:hypothetical protein
MGFHRRPDRIRLPGTPRLPQGGDMVDIDAKFDQGFILMLFVARKGRLLFHGVERILGRLVPLYCCLAKPLHCLKILRLNISR